MRILIVDDDAMSREAVSSFLAEDLGHDVIQCDSGSKALDFFLRDPTPLVVTDVRMPGMSGFDLLRGIRSSVQGADTCVIVMTGFGDMETAIQALRDGACDFLLKPLNIEELAVVIERVAENMAVRRTGENAAAVTGADEAEAEAEPSPSRSDEPVPGIGEVGVFSPALRATARLAERLHGYRTVPVLIEGETGTGKEIMARLVHHGAGRVEGGPFVTVNCSAISPSLFESELFGYDRGAFTGASSSGKTGKLELAQGGTLFLDEIGDLPLDMQPKLLRVLQQREMFRVGSTRKIQLDVRLVCATNRDLEEMVAAGDFRRDLFYRLNVGRIAVPPLRDRREEIVPLAQLFLEKFSERHDRRFRFITSGAREALVAHDWPGNVRELENTIERITLLYDGRELRADHLRFETGGEIPDIDDQNMLRPGRITLPPDHLDLEQLELEIVRKALRKFKGNKTRTAAYLGLSRGALYTRLNRIEK